MKTPCRRRAGCAEGYQRQAAAETDDTATARYGLSYIVTHFSRMTSASLCFGSTCETRRPSNGEWNYISVGSLILSPPSSSSPSTRIRRSSSSVLPLCSPSRGPPRPDAPLPLRSWSARRRCVFSRRVRARSSRPYMFHWHVGCAGPFFARWSPLWSSPCIRPLPESLMRRRRRRRRRRCGRGRALVDSSMHYMSDYKFKHISPT